MGNIKMDETPVETCNADGLISFLCLYFIYYLVLFRLAE